jgi:DNA-binding response OmpR family regulator
METALIVEDDRDQAELAAELVRLRRFNPVTAGTGREALTLARRVTPSLVLLDLMLPDLDGFEVCRRLRTDPVTRTVPVVMVTALGDDSNRRRGFRVGANAYVTKPYGPEELFAAMEAAQAWRDTIRERRLEGEIHVELNSEPVFLQDVNEFLTSLYRETPLSGEQIMQMRQALMEMGQNAIEWGNKHRVEELVEITYRVSSDRVEIVVRDQGGGFDRTKLTHAASADDPLAHMDVREKLGLRDGGFGMLISRGMVDDLRYNEKGNEVTLIKRFPDDAGLPPDPEGSDPASR